MIKKRKKTESLQTKGKRLASEIYNLLAKEGLTVGQSGDVLYLTREMVQERAEGTQLK